MVRAPKKVCGIRDRYLYIGCIFFSALIALMRIGLLRIPKWYYQGKDLKKWEGGLFSVYKSGGFIRKKEYQKLSDDFCEERTNYYTANTNHNLTYYEVDSMCRKFLTLSSVSGFFVAFAIISSLTKLLRIIFMLRIDKLSKPEACILVLVFFDLILEFISCVVLGSAPKVTFRGDCHYLSRLGESTLDLNTCGDIGSAVNIFFTIFSLLFDILIISLIIAYINCGEVIAIENPVSSRQEQILIEIPSFHPNEDDIAKAKDIEYVD